jgi:oligopeptide transport system substrate-binding protein
MKSRFVRTIAAVCLMIFCGSCTHPSQQHKTSERLRLYVNPEPISLDPRIGGTITAQLVIYQLFEGLTRYGTDGRPQLAIAEAVHLSNDRTTYIFHLRPTKWSNGDELTAMDFEYAWKSVLQSSLVSQYADSFFSIKNARRAHNNECSLDDVGIHALDMRTLEVTLEQPAPYFLEWTSDPLYAPVHRPTVEREEHWARHAFPIYVCNGPYLLKEYRPGSHIVLEKNPLYWNTKDCAKTKTIKFSILGDPIAAYNMFKAGDLDWYGAPFSISIPPEIITALKKDGLLGSAPTGPTLRIDCCVTKPHLASVKIRKALACAINRKELVSYLLIGGDRPATSLVTESFSLQKSPQFEDGNAELARQLFEEGCAELGYTKETYPPLVLAAKPRSKIVAEVVSEQLQKVLGIKVRPEVHDIQIFRTKRAALELELAIEGLTTGLRDPIYDLGCFKYNDAGLTSTNWKNPEYQRLLDASGAASDETERKELLRQAEELLMKEMPAIPLVYEAEKYAKNPHILGEQFLPATILELKHFEKVRR